MRQWYFAYGSNLSIDQMIERTVANRPTEFDPRVACLANHRLIFQYLDDTGSAFANILAPGEGVLGVIYHCSQIDLQRLDDFERGYVRQSILVTDQHGEELAAITYVVDPGPNTIMGRPSAEYLERITTGARQHGLPEWYVHDIVAIAQIGI